MSRTQRARERVAALALAAVLGLVAALLVVRLSATEAGIHLPMWVYAVLVAAAQAPVVHVQVRRQSAVVSLSSVIGVVGLAFCGPREFVAGTMLGSFGVLLAKRRQSWPKLVFNLSLFALMSSTMRTVFELSTIAALPADVRFAGAAILAVVADLLTGALGLGAVLLASTGRLDVRALVRTCGTGLLLDGAAGALGVLAVLLTRHAPVGLPLLGAVVTLLLLGARAYSSLDWRHQRMASLYAFTSTVSGVDDLRELALRICREAREILHCDSASLAVDTGSGVLRAEVGVEETARVELEPVTPADLPSTADDPGSLHVPLLAGNTDLGHLRVAGRWRYLGEFTPEDRKLFASLADHAAVALQSALLLQRVREDAAERRHQALHDPVTGLWNRRGLVEAAERRDPASVALLVLDLIGFSDINDTLGQPVGDQLLRHVAGSLTAVAGADCVARFGNDEFGVLLDALPDTRSSVGGGDAVRQAQAVLAHLEQPFALQGLTLQVSTQAGLALGGTARDGGAATLAQQADAALAAAKRSGMALHVHDSTDDEQNARRVRLVSDLRRAVAADALDVFYQPKLDARTGAVVGAEALARWVHPTEGFVPPDVFIPLAEQAGLIPALTASVLRTALAALARWRSWGHPLTMSVNLSARMLRDPSFLEEVDGALEATGLRADDLMLEITESAVMEDITAARAMLDDLRRRGVGLSLDDFGTGHSSLAHLATLPVDELKLDKAFVLGLPQDATSLAIVRAAIDLGHQLGLTVVAEGVETVEAQELLVRRNCDIVQGYLHSRPLPVGDFDKWLQARSGALSPA